MDNTITIFKFFSTDRTPPRFPTAPLQPPFQIPMDFSYLRYYFPGHAPEPPSNVAIMMYVGHTIEFKTLSTNAEAWLQTRNATWTAMTIQSEHTKNLCWFVYSTKTPTARTSGQPSPTSWGRPSASNLKQSRPAHHINQQHPRCTSWPTKWIAAPLWHNSTTYTVKAA